jgi:catechol 2,3-dioxygenase-like lactoylglutathione lyase family enzyme
VEVLSSRLILHPTDLAKSRHFYEELLGLRLFHEYAHEGELVGVVYFLGGGFLELSAARPGSADGYSRVWLQVPDVRREEERLARLGVAIECPAERKPWGLVEMSLQDPDGQEVLLVEVPEDHFLRRQL